MSSKTTDEKPLTKAANILQGVAKPVIGIISVALPWIIETSMKAYAVYEKLPTNAVHFICGFIFCFFGGLYPTLFAAIQGLEQGGRKTVIAALNALAEEAMVIIDASKKDDTADNDNDGKADVDAIPGRELLVRKAQLVMTKMNPEKVDKAIGSIYKTWLAVIAVLKLQFARTISMALAISEFLDRPVNRFILPTVNSATPDEYKKWIPIVLSWATKAIAMSFAWYVQTIISAVTSGIKGGLMMSRAFYKYCITNNMDLGGLIKANHKDTYIDEVVMYVFAFMGIWFQFKIGFSAPFPLNFVLWPFQIAENFIRWTITSK